MNVDPIAPSARAQNHPVAEVTPARGRPLTGAALRNAPEAVQRTEVAQQFEAIMVRQLLAPTMKSIMASESEAVGSVYGDLLTDTLSQQLSRGGGLGLAQMIAQQLTPRSSTVAATPAAPKSL